jgi:RluA family pseudouridine synthase
LFIIHYSLFIAIMTRIMKITIPDGFFPSRLDRYLSRRFDYLSRSAWQKEIEAEKLTLNGYVCTDASRLLKAGDTVEWDGRGIEEPPVDDTITVLHQDEYFIAVNKTGDLPVHPAGRYFHNTLTMLLGDRLGRRVFPVHRLDRETSGVILCAFTSEAAAKLSDAISNGIKEYAALVHGIFPDEKIRIDLPLGSDEKSPVMKKRKAFPGAPESALTLFKKIISFGNYSLVRCYPETGRLHQIRAHLLSAGFPIVGDKIYGIDDRLFIEFIETGMTENLARRLILPRCALHAARLKFIHPFEKKEMILSAPLPQMFIDFILITRRNG